MAINQLQETYQESLHIFCFEHIGRAATPIHLVFMLTFTALLPLPVNQM